MSKKKDCNSIPKKIELFGRKISTVIESDKLNLKQAVGEARYGVNQIALAVAIRDNTVQVSPDELKVTYLHEMLHFILNFTQYEQIILDNKKIDLEQFIELLAIAIYQYEKSAEY